VVELRLIGAVATGFVDDADVVWEGLIVAHVAVVEYKVALAVDYKVCSAGDGVVSEGRGGSGEGRIKVVLLL